jgi:hypothetical protein
MKKVEQIYLHHTTDPLLRQEHLGNTYLEMARVLNKSKENENIEMAI